MFVASAYVAYYGELHPVEHGSIVGSRMTLCGKPVAIVYDHLDFTRNYSNQCEACKSALESEGT